MPSPTRDRVRAGVGAGQAAAWRGGTSLASAVRMDARRRSVRALAAVVALLCLTLIAPAAAGAASKLRPVTGKLNVKVGIGDQKAEAFDDDRLRDLGVGYARRSVAWDALRNADQRAALDAWVHGAQGMGAEPLITFARSRKIAGRQHRPPTSAQFLREFKRFRKRSRNRSGRWW